MISTITYNGDGVTRVFPVSFEIQGEEYVVIYINNIAVADRTAYDIINNSIVFNIGEEPPTGTDNVQIVVASSPNEIADLNAPPSNIQTVLDNLVNITSVAEQVVPNLPEILLADNSAATATEQSGIATTQADIATTKAAEAATYASNALTSENNAIAAAQAAGVSADEVGTWTIASPFSVATIGDLSTIDINKYNIAIVKDLNRGGTFIWSATGTANGGTVFAGATGYWNRQYSGAVNVKWFGAVGDGVADDTNAIKFVCENFNDIEGDIEDTYKVVTTTFGSSNYDGIQISSNTKIKKLNIYCTGFIPSGIHTEIPSLFKLIDAQNVTIEGCSFDSSSELDARITSFEKGVYTYIAISSTVDYGSSNIKILNNKFSKNLGACVGGFPSPIDGLNYYKSDIVVSNNHFYDVGNHCFSMEKGYNNIVSNNTMNNQIGTQFTGYVVGAFCDFSQGTVGSICTGNICDGVQTGVKTESDGYLNNYSENNIISNNIFINFKGEGSATSNYGIQLNGVLDRAFGNTIKLGVNPTTGVATPTLIIGLKAQSGAYKCVFDNNKVDVNGVGVWCYAQNEPSNLSFLKITNNIVSCASSLAIQFIDARNIFISGNNLTGTTDLISATGNNFTIINNILNTTSPSVGAIYLNEPNINISAYVFNISNNTINIETSGATVGFNTTPSLPYEKVTMVGNTITSKANENVIQLFSTNSLVFSNNIININNPTQTTDRRCLMLRSGAYVCVDAVITGNILHNNGTSFGNAIFGEFRNSIIANNSLKSFNACINLDGGQNTSIMNNSYAGSSIASTLGTGTVSLNNIVKI